MNIIATRRNRTLQSKESIYRLLDDCYSGGQKFLNSKHLFQYFRESSKGYDTRIKRSIYFNYVQPLADILAGFIYANKPTREIPSELSYLVNNAYKGKSLNQFMQSIAIKSLLFTVGILIDSPSYDPDEIQTMRDRVENNLNPYLVTYYPWQIRDFYFDDDNKLEWVLLDNSYCDKSNPLESPIDRTIYTLWTPNQTINYELTEQGVNQLSVVDHNLGEVPFLFLNWRDDNDDKISDSPFEDIALISKAIYNHISLIDEMIYAGSFKSLFYPTATGAIPDEMTQGGIGSLAVIPYDGNLSQKPYFDGAGLSDVNPYFQAIQFFINQIFSKLGLDIDREKKYVQSGVAKSLEFQKCESLLRIASESLQQTEIEIFRLASKWENKELPEDLKIEYYTEFQSEDIDIQLSRLYQVLSINNDSLKKFAESEIIKKTLSFVPAEELSELMEEIEKEESDKEEEMKNMKSELNSVIERSAADTAQSTSSDLENSTNNTETIR